MARTITTTRHGHTVGERISVTLLEPDNRWWRRAWFWLTRQHHPMREVKYSGTVTSASTFTIE